MKKKFGKLVLVYVIRIQGFFNVAQNTRNLKQFNSQFIAQCASQSKCENGIFPHSLPLALYCCVAFAYTYCFLRLWNCGKCHFAYILYTYMDVTFAFHTRIHRLPNNPKIHYAGLTNFIVDSNFWIIHLWYG